MEDIEPLIFFYSYSETVSDSAVEYKVDGSVDVTQNTIDNFSQVPPCLSFFWALSWFAMSLIVAVLDYLHMFHLFLAMLFWDAVLLLCEKPGPTQTHKYGSTKRSRRFAKVKTPTLLGFPRLWMILTCFLLFFTASAPPYHELCTSISKTYQRSKGIAALMNLDGAALLDFHCRNF